jgi:hypothetical protein
MKCKKCENNLFIIQIIPCCDDCDQNAAYDHDEAEYTLDLKTIEEKELIRNHVSEEGECTFDQAWGSGCYLFTCSKCGSKSNLAVMEGC